MKKITLLFFLIFSFSSAHKFHGPKGVGFAFFRKGFGIMPMFHGGDQERGARSSEKKWRFLRGSYMQ